MNNSNIRITQCEIIEDENVNDNFDEFNVNNTEMQIFECPICLDKIKYSTVGSCMHHFCFYCLLRHCKFSNKCPMCKVPINELRIDREFDNLINGDLLPTFNYSNEIIIESDENINNPGLTIKNNLKGPGVIISNIKSSGLFKKYDFKERDILLFINNVPCNNHKLVMEQIMSLFKSGLPMKIIKL